MAVAEVERSGAVFLVNPELMLRMVNGFEGRRNPFKHKRVNPPIGDMGGGLGWPYYISVYQYTDGSNCINLKSYNYVIT